MVEAVQKKRGVAAGFLSRGSRTVLASVPLEKIHPNPLQPRRHFDDTALAELAASIKVRGLLQPIIVKPDGDGFLVMAGERRYRASKLAGLDRVPVLVRKDDELEVAIIENLQREDLSPLEEAEGLGALIDRYGYTHEVLAELVGKSRPYVSNTLALRRLPEEIKREYHEKPDVSREILISVARAESPEKQALLWRLARIRKLSVQRFRDEQAGKSGAPDEVAEVTRLVRRLGRKLRALKSVSLPPEQREQMERALKRGRVTLDKALKHLEKNGEEVPEESISP